MKWTDADNCIDVFIHVFVPLVTFKCHLNALTSKVRDSFLRLFLLIGSLRSTH
jgi:hypothetical protein